MSQPAGTVTLYCSNPALPQAEFLQRKAALRGRRAPIRVAPLSRTCVPVWVRFSTTTIISCARDKATHVLIHVSDQKDEISGVGHFRVGRYSVPVTLVSNGGINAMYLDVEYPVTQLPPLVKQRLSVMYSMVDNYDFSDVDGCNTPALILRPTFKGVYPKQPDRPPRTGEFERAKITGEHHTHIRPEEVWEAFSGDRNREYIMLALLSKLRRIGGATEAFVATALLYVASVKLPVAMQVATSDWVWVGDIDTVMSNLKKASTPMKALQNANYVDLTDLFELQTLVNRGVGMIDWALEKEHRVNPDVIDVDPRDVYDAAVRIFKTGARHGFQYKRMGLDDFTAARWEWSPSGSVHSQYEEDQQYILRENYRHRTKFVTLNAMSKEHIKSFFTRPPQVRAWPSVKYEWGKERAIYGVDLTSATVAHFGLYNCEEVFKHRFPVGEDAEAERVHKRLKMMLESSESCCYDFDDFNAQHSTASMMAVITAYRDTFLGQMSEAQADAVQWVADSLLDVKVVPSDGSPYTVNGTLLSGSRLTTFLNTALNFIYMDIAGALSTPGVVDSVHNGDDVLLAVRTTKAVVQVHSRMARINARAQATKCNVFSTGEFLRVDHKLELSDGLGAQYATRACATAVHSRVESQQPVRATLAAEAAVTRIKELTRRCPQASVGHKRLLDSIISRLASIYRVPYQALLIAVHTHVVAGGLSTERWAPVEILVEEKVTYQAAEGDEADVDVIKLTPGIIDYARRLHRVVREKVSYDTIKASVYRATRSQLDVTRKTRLELSDVSLSVKYKCARALHRMLKSVIRLPFIPRARFLNVPPVALATSDQLDKLFSVIPTTGDTAWAMKVML